MSNEPSNELFPPSDPSWCVITCCHRQTKQEIAAKKPKTISHHELLYGNHVESRRKGDSGLETLREMARFLNRRNLVPRPRIQCGADAPNLDAFLKKAAANL